ncbi:putative recombination initiation defects 3 [Diospyros lotus]|uniref:putative recombination initiation defects 3 n=1 Tax=Diospyros lotus TaxID=55363 RepID=UPI00224EDE48|nr:putative recombination initiation defects 3 [Diospyros lotus]
MKLKINKACDLSAISVLPPHSRRSSIVSNGAGTSAAFGRSQMSQIRSQPSQQSFSQGVSSQHGIFSQLSQNSLDDVVTNDQRPGSQERENSVKKVSCLPPVNYSRDESQLAISRSSTNLMRRWSSSSPADHRCQTSEELERRIAIVETSLNRLGMILDCVQSDIMQVNKGTKEVLLEMEGMRQKLVANDNLLQLMNKGQEDMKNNLVGGLKSISDQVSQDTYREGLKESLSIVSDLPEQIDLWLQKLKSELCTTVMQELQAIPCSLRIPSQKLQSPTVSPEDNHRAAPLWMAPVKNPEVHPEIPGKAILVPKIEVGNWTAVKKGQATFTYSGLTNEHKQQKLSSIEMGRECRVINESDEEIDGGFSCLLEEKETDIGSSFTMAEAKEATERILRKARRRKRKYVNNIIILE